MRPVVVESIVTLGSPPADVWPYLTDTDRMNRLYASAAVFRPIEPGARSSARFVVETRTGGFPMSYEEAPFEWTVPKRFSVERRMRTGPLTSYVYRTDFDPTAAGGTKVTVRIELAPRHALLRPIVAWQGKRFTERVAELARAVDAHVRGAGPSPYGAPPAAVREDRLAAAGAALAERGVDAAVSRAIIDLVRSGSDVDLVRLRPFEIAASRGLDARDTLRGFLHAVTVGLVELRWALVCPSCRTANDHVTSLAELEATSHCQLCDLTYGIELDRAVEATFRPHPSVREVTDALFCVGGPWRTPHVLRQAVVDEGASRDVEAPSASGRYRLFARGGAVARVEVLSDGPAVSEVTLGASFEPPELTVSPDGIVRVKNASGAALHVKLETLAYASHAATAHALTTMEEFRRLFSRELLKPSTPLRVAHAAILFSDLTGSTALYSKAGDAAAFRLVDDHFDVLRRAIGECGGAVVKTMGDAVMAAFRDPESCARAAIACLRAFEVFRRTHPHGEDTGLKVGVFAGPCYVVTANDAIDYFGQTVNCASRVQHLAESGELVLEEELYAALPEGDRAGLALVARLDARVKGVDVPLRLVRARVVSPAEG